MKQIDQQRLEEIEARIRSKRLSYYFDVSSCAKNCGKKHDVSKLEVIPSAPAMPQGGQQLVVHAGHEAALQVT